MKSKYFILDASWLAHTKFFSGRHGEFFETIDYFNSSGRVILCWDNPEAKNHRKQMLPDYKSNRPPKSDELIDYINEVMVRCRDLCLWQYKPKEGEGDDAIHTIANSFRATCGIVSCDKDFLQCVSENISFVKFSKNLFKEITNENIVEITGFAPSQWLQIQALCGDQADNYSGVRGIGETIAKKIIKLYPDFVYQVLRGESSSLIDEVRKTSPSLLKHAVNILNNVQALNLSYEMARLVMVKVERI